MSGAIRRSVVGVGESDRTMDIVVRRGLPLRSWQAEESRTRMSKVLRKRRLPWPSGLILAGAPQRQLRLLPCPKFPVRSVAGAERSGYPPDNRSRQASFAAYTRFHARQGDAEALTGQIQNWGGQCKGYDRVRRGGTGGAGMASGVVQVVPWLLWPVRRYVGTTAESERFNGCGHTRNHVFSCFP